MNLQTAKTCPIAKTIRAMIGPLLVLFAVTSVSFAGDARRPSIARRSDFGLPPDRFDVPRVNARRTRSTTVVPTERERYRLPGRAPFDTRKPVNSDEELLPRVTPRRTPEFPRTRDLAPSEPTLEQKITRRYQDPRVMRVLTELTGAQGEAFFREVSQMIDDRHIEPTNYAERSDQGFEHLKLAVANSSFQQATGIHPSLTQIRLLRAQLEALQQEIRVRNYADALSALRQAARLSQQSVGLNPGAVCFEFVYAALDSLDKYSMLLPPEKSGGVNVGLDENLVGIGVEVAADPAGLKIVKTIPGGPAAVAALRQGDVITAVDGRPVQGMALGQAVDLITGQAGTRVKLSLQRERLIADVSLVRRPVTVHSLSAVQMLDETSHVGYIKLDQFAESSSRELDDALWKLHRAGMEALVLDLRGNPGGYLTTAIEISDRFLPAGTIVTTRGRTDEDNSRETAQYAQTWKTPLVVLIDHASASASEIFAAAIQENGRGLIVGETSYGKGTVQTLFPLSSVTAGLRLTTAKFYSPDGRSMAGAGVTPDLSVRTGGSDDDAEMLSTALEAARDPRVQAMARSVNRPHRTGTRSIQVVDR